MGNRAPIVCGSSAQNCVDECARLQFELDGPGRDPDESDCDPAGAIFNETLHGLAQLESQALRFGGSANLSAVRWLVAMGANLRARDRNHTTMMHAACRSGSFHVVQELLPRNLPLDAIDIAGWTPLHIAAVMGRRDVCVLLLQAKASVAVNNKKGKTAMDLCSDPCTNEVLRDFVAHGGGGRLRGQPLTHNLVPQDGNEGPPTCEPFFVPRSPFFHDDAHRAELAHIGVEMFSKSAGHSLAFLVATGTVHDHPSDLSAFMVAKKVDPVQLGSFLGEDYSLSKTLRLAFCHGVDLEGTGMVLALAKAFKHLRAPPDLQKIDRLTNGVSHLWWRTHDPEHDPTSELSFMEDMYQLPSGTGCDGVTLEFSGMTLRRMVQSIEGFRRLMFSTVMLSWNLHADMEAFPAPPRPKMTVQNWIEINRGVELDGSDIPVNLQANIFETILAQPIPQLLPYFSLRADETEVDKAFSSHSRPKTLQDIYASRDAEMSVQGWSSIPPSGLERQEPANSDGVGRMLPRRGTKPACIISEASGLVAQGWNANQEVPSEGEHVWLRLRFDVLLTMSATPGQAPYAILRMQDAAIREVRIEERQIVLVGRLKEAPDTARSGRGASSGGLGTLKSPYGDAARFPLPLCFLLADGRFEPYDALWLELQLDNVDDLEKWARAFRRATDDSGAYGMTETSPLRARLPTTTAASSRQPPTVPPDPLRASPSGSEEIDSDVAGYDADRPPPAG